MQDRRSSTVVQEPAAQPTCRHHWVIESPAGPVSNGVCRLCGEKREFKNYLENPRWEDFALDRPSSSEKYLGANKADVGFEAVA